MSSRKDSGLPRKRGNHFRWTLAAAALLLLLGSGVSSYLVVQQFNTVHRLTAYNFGADASQAAIEVLRLESLVTRQAFHLPNSSLPKIQLWAEILEGRARELASTNFRRLTASDPDLTHTVERLKSSVAQIQQLIPHFDEAGVPAQIISALAPFADELPGYASFVYNSVDANIEQGFAALSLLWHVSFLIIVAFFLVLGWLLWTIWRDEQITRETLAANEALSADNRSKTMMIAGVSHEIRTPLMALLGVTEMLSRTELSRSQNEMISAASAAGRSLLSLVNGMLDFGKIEAGGLSLKVAPFDLPRLLSEIISVIRLGSQAAEIKLSLFLANDVPGMVVGDEERLSIVLNNLLANAVKFTPPGGKVCLTVQLETLAPSGEATLLFEVEDTGIGIAPEALENIFGTFTQADATVVDRYGGAGLGLATCKALVRLHGGEIGVRSKLGEGSTFWIRISLPRGPATDDVSPREWRFLAVNAGTLLESDLHRRFVAAGVHIDPLEAAAESQSSDETWDAILYNEETLSVGVNDKSPSFLGISQATPRVVVQDRSRGLGATYSECFTAITPGADDEEIQRMLRLIASRTAVLASPCISLPEHQNSLKVLVADDNAINRRIVRRFLENGGHAVTAVTTGREAVAALQSQRFDVAIIDINMPDMNGLEAAAYYHSRTPFDMRVPLIALTADPSDETLRRCTEVGVVARLVKPIDNAELLQAVTRWTSTQEQMGR